MENMTKPGDTLDMVNNNRQLLKLSMAISIPMLMNTWRRSYRHFCQAMDPLKVVSINFEVAFLASKIISTTLSSYFQFPSFLTFDGLNNSHSLVTFSSVLL